MWGMRRAAILLACVLTGCPAAQPTLAIDLRTDFLPAVDFIAVRTEIARGSATVYENEAMVSSADDFLAGARVAQLELEPGEYVLRLTLLGPGASELVARNAAFVMPDANLALTVLVTRDCAGVVCPGPGDDASLTECVGGRCVDPGCTPGSPLCGAPECASDAECAAGVDCAEGVCLEGVCLVAAHDERCTEEQFCNPEVGCMRPTPDAGMCDADLTSDPNNCGLCGLVCADRYGDRVDHCEAGSCVCGSDGRCSLSQSCCGARCVDTDSDEARCGSCTNACTASQTCCDGVCADTQSSVANCGACGAACDARSDTCASGACRCGSGPPCAVNLSCCGGACIDTRTATSHCGACGTVCSGPRVNSCRLGDCECAGEFNECFGSQTCCASGCNDLASSETDCGACGNSCAALVSPQGAARADRCDGGECVCGFRGTEPCAAALSCCSSECVNLDSDVDHCGRCNTRCGSTEVCVAGRCECGATIGPLGSRACPANYCCQSCPGGPACVDSSSMCPSACP